NRKVDFTDKNGRRIKYSYADLADVIECVAKPLSDNGLAVSQQLKIVDGSFGLMTVLMHSSGESIDSWYPLPDPKTLNAQAFGSALTYARRYSLSSIVGISSEE